MSENTRANVTINGWTVPTNFHFRISDVWPGGGGYGHTVFFDRDMSAPAVELINHISMWGGHSKEHPETGHRGWELHETMLPIFYVLVERTRHTRPKDDEVAHARLQELVTKPIVVTNMTL